MFLGTVSKKVGEISYDDWLGYTSRFLKTFDSAYKKPCNIKICINTSKYANDGAHIGFLIRAARSKIQIDEEDIMFRSESTKLDKTLESKMKMAIPKNLFEKIPEINLRIEPIKKTKFEHDLGYSDFKKIRPYNISFYAQGKIKMTNRLYKEFKPKDKNEALSFELSNGMHSHIEIFGKF